MNIPKLRFKEFTDEWTLQYFNKFLIERNIIANEKLNLYSLTIEKGIIPKNEQYEREFLINKIDEAYKEIQKNDFVYNPMNIRFGAVGRFKKGIHAKVSKYYNVFYCNNNLNNIFFEFLIKTKKLLNLYNKLAIGSLNEKKRLHYSDFLKIKYYMPSLQEQEKIANFLATVDEKIINLENTITSLENQKKGLLQQIFSQKLRFKDKNSNNYPNWEKKKLGDILKICHGKDYKNEPNEKKLYPVLGTGGIITYIDNFLCNWKCVLIGRKGTINKPQYMETPFWSVDTLFYSKPKTKQNPKFQYYLFQNINWIKYDESTGVPSLSASTIENISFVLPCLEEQTKIADFLSAFDRKLDNQKAQLEHWKQIKKGLLQQMFV